MKTLPEPMQINETLIYIAVIFIVLYFILKKFYVNPFWNILSERERKIEGAENRFKEVEDYYREKMMQYEEEIRKARINANSLREKLIEEAKKEREAIVNTAKLNSRETVEKTENEIKKTLEEQLEEAKKYTETLSKLIAEKILGRKLA